MVQQGEVTVAKAADLGSVPGLSHIMEREN